MPPRSAALFAVDASDLLPESLLGGEQAAVATASALTDMSDTMTLVTFFTITSGSIQLRGRPHIRPVKAMMA